MPTLAELLNGLRDSGAQWGRGVQQRASSLAEVLANPQMVADQFRTPPDLKGILSQPVPPQGALAQKAVDYGMNMGPGALGNLGGLLGSTLNKGVGLLANAEGVPIRVFHGTQTPVDIKRFRTPTYFSDTPHESPNTWANLIGPNEEAIAKGVTVLGAPKIYPAYLKMKNPYDAETGNLKFNGQWIDPENLTPGVDKFLQGLGYDGIKYTMVRGRSNVPSETIYIAFKPGQIVPGVGKPPE